jgi:hypothetical protein
MSELRAFIDDLEAVVRSTDDQPLVRSPDAG